MDYGRIAAAAIEHVGGKSNIKSVAHCATRLRFQLKDTSLRNEEVISDLEGVKGVFLTQSQFQIIFGSGLVNLVCAEVQKQLGLVEEQESGSATEAEEKKGNVFQRFVKLLSDIFVPIIPAIVAGGLLMGINNLLTSDLIHGQSVIELYPQWTGLASAINMFANAPFTFLPVLIGFSATKKFGGNPFLGAAMGMIMVHPDLLNAYSIGVADPPVWDIFGLKIAAIGYQGTVLPVLAVSWILASIEKRLHKVTPTWLDNLTTPMVSILITSFLTFIAVGPVLREAGNLLAAGITWMYNTLGFVGGGIFGLAYAPITLTGMHHSFIAIETQLIAESAKTGGSFIFSTASMNNVAQGAAVLAVLLLTKNEKMKSICSASGVSALLGITEPAMFGVTLKLKYPFYAAIIGSGVGSAFLAATKTLAQALGAAGLPGFISMKPDHYVDFAIGIVLSMAVSFLLTIIFWKKFHVEETDGTKQGVSREVQAEEETEAAEADKEEGVQESAEELAEDRSKNHRIRVEMVSPVRGNVMPIRDSADPAFASRAMGDGIAVDPVEGMVYAPCDGTISLLFPTNHAVGIRTGEGVEFLIHIGIDTVTLNGEGFKPLVAADDKVKKGQPIIQFDLDCLKAKNLNPQTMVMVPEAGNAVFTVYPDSCGDETKLAMTIEVEKK
ncbi:MAG: sucrose-specific PTS transporter subunit IIBC [Hungatella sp.]